MDDKTVKNDNLGAHPDDQRHVASFNRKLSLIRDRVRSVVYRHATGLYLVGRHGTGKTHTIKKELEAQDALWVYQNARMTPMGLFDFLAEHPDHVCVLDDIPTLFKKDEALQILLAALDGNAKKPRLVTYKSDDRDLRFEFRGAIIALSNVSLRHDPVAAALGSRVQTLLHEPSDDELAAFIRLLAARGDGDLTPDECWEVAHFVITETRAFDLRLDLRHYTKGLEDYRQFKRGLAENHWRDLVRSSLLKSLEETFILRKADEIDEQREKVREVMKKFPKDSKRQMQESGLNKSTFYKRRKEVQAK